MYNMKIGYLIIGLIVTVAIPLSILKIVIYFSDKRSKNGKG